ncbi:inner nuclear membrane protein enriched at telomere/subtelomere region [Paecilomyces lecythidis]|uniref:Inner nuclear membrane protein enriched at telomere/subtelomere region n=1 Tax=Paecilomyces lecythidis TaxID=3004212 RepID=A0ABR3XMK8_9EURO
MASGFDDLEYLSPDFDLNSLTVPRIRAILVNHDVSYPASAKKAQLIRILQDEVLPKAQRLLRDRERVRRTSEGITDMSSRETSVVDENNDPYGHDRDSMPPPPTPSTTTSTRRGRGRPSTRASTADTENEQPYLTPSTASGRRTARTGATKHPRASDTETGEDVLTTPVARRSASPRKSTARKLRKSEAIPSTEPLVETHRTPSPIKREAHDESVFTDDNPFQSGSPSPWDNPRTSMSSRSRKSTSRLSSESAFAREERKKRKSEGPIKIKQEDGVDVPTRSTFEFPVSRLRKSLEEEIEEEDEGDDEDVSAGEEFTPEEQLALDQEFANSNHAVIRRQKPRKQGTVSKAASWLVILSLLGSFGAWWRKEKVEIGYCGIGKETWSLTDTNVPQWAKILEPQCEPCPPHAFCYPDFKAECEQDFVLKPHPLSLGGLVPLPPTCEPDSEKARRVKAVADRAVDELRDRRAKFECGELKEDSKRAKSPSIAEPDLKKEVSKKRRRGMSDAEFDDLWKGALGEIVGRDEVVSESKGPTDVLTLTSTSLARLPIVCAFRRHLRLSLLAYRLPISILIIFISALAHARSRVLRHRSDMARVPELVATTLDRLATQAALYARGDAREPWVPIGQLRDDVLRTELQGSRREALWKRVRSVVEGNANVRAAVREGRGGDVSRVWEWIGGIGGVGGDLESSARRESGKVRFSVSPGEDSLARADVNGDTGAVRSPRESRKWDEGHPVY